MYKGLRIVATIEARMTSSRLPGKVLLEYCEKTNLQHMVERLKRSRYVDDVVIATTVNETDSPIVELCKKIDCNYSRGSEEDVLLRVLEAAKSAKADVIVEITGDCPMIDWRHVDFLVEKYEDEGVDYCANIIKRSFPRGFDTQVFSVAALDKVNHLTKSPIDHEHVSLYMYTHRELFSLSNWEAQGLLNHPEIEVTLDMKEDYELIREIYEKLYPQNPDFSAEDVINCILEDPGLYKRSQGGHRKDVFKEQKEWEENYGQRV